MLMCVWSAQLAKASMLQAPYLQASCQGGRIHQRLQHAEESQDPRGQVRLRCSVMLGLSIHFHIKHQNFVMITML